MGPFFGTSLYLRHHGSELYDGAYEECHGQHVEAPGALPAPPQRPQVQPDGHEGDAEEEQKEDRPLVVVAWVAVRVHQHLKEERGLKGGGKC